MERPDWMTWWQALTPVQAAAEFAGFPARWWIAGGWAIDLYAGEPYRQHSDIDIEILRPDVDLLHDALNGWELHACQWPDGSTFHLWQPGEPLPPAVHDIWCRRNVDTPWAFQLMVLDRDQDRWVFRRDHRIGGPLADLGIACAGLPVIAPEVQLLFKSKGRREKDERDLDRALPLLDARQKAWLRDALRLTDPGNPWLARLG
jgi:hypothetical protein